MLCTVDRPDNAPRRREQRPGTIGTEPSDLTLPCRYALDADYTELARAAATAQEAIEAIHVA